MDGRMASLVDIFVDHAFPRQSIYAVEDIVMETSAFYNHVSTVSARGRFNLGVMSLCKRNFSESRFLIFFIR